MTFLDGDIAAFLSTILVGASSLERKSAVVMVLAARLFCVVPAVVADVISSKSVPALVLVYLCGKSLPDFNFL